MGWSVLDISMLRDVDLFVGVSDQTLNRILSLGSIVRHAHGDVIFSEGDVGDTLFAVLEGEVRISREIPGVGEEALAMMGPGSCFGEMALVGDESTRSASAICNNPVALMCISRSDFMALVERDGAMGREILSSFVNTLSRRLRTSNDKVAFLAMSNLFE